MPTYQSRQCLHVRVAVVERWDVFKARAARSEELLAITDRYLFECFQAVDRKTRTQHLHFARAALRPCGQDALSIRAEPDFASDTRLKTHRQLILVQAEAFAQQARC